MPLKILIVGAGVGGPALAYALRRTNPTHLITIIEKYPDLRSSGQQIDLRGQGVPTMRKLGLLEKLKEITVGEEGIKLVTSEGKTQATFLMNNTGNGNQSFTSEYEFMRGDLVKLLVEASLKEYGGEKPSEKSGGVHYEFDKSPTSLKQDASGVDVTFSNGTSDRYDLVYIGYYTVPRAADEDAFAKLYLAPGGRFLSTRSGQSAPTTQVYVGTSVARATAACGDGDGDTRLFRKLPAARQKQYFADYYAGCGWQADRLVRDGLPAAADYYGHEVGQVRLPGGTFVDGRVALLGDAGYCPSPSSGMGTTIALLGAYVLAGEIARHCDGDGAAGKVVARAVQAYQDTMRPYVAEIQKLPLAGQGLLSLPESRLGIYLLYKAAWLVAALRVDKMLSWLAPEDKGGLAIPEYPEMKLDTLK
ncbi:hypothetical protein F4780DRAFT_770350 [Xylariomycetidae sp. FL0641]|nr:hypothetical protein F4780DRAFT_770350 [Xylariomycetidae sp. FL0641]